MNTLQEDIDDLDRMVDTDAQKDAIRSQIRLISREVSALQADHAQLVDRHANLQKRHAKLQNAHTKLKASKKKRITQAWDEISTSDNIA